MNLPSRDDPRWRSIVTGTNDYSLENLSAQLVISRVRLMTWDQKEASIEKAIDVVHSFFVKNAEQTKSDLHAIFGRGLL